MVKMARVLQEAVGVKQRPSPALNLLKVVELSLVLTTKGGHVIVGLVKEDDDVGLVGRIELADGLDESFEPFEEALIGTSRKADLSHRLRAPKTVGP
jgi:hypothetical protein